MALHLVPPQPSEEDSASNRGDSPEPCFDDCSSEHTQASTANFPSSTVDAVDGFDFPRDDDQGIWSNPHDMAIPKLVGSECSLQLKRLPLGTKPVRLVGEGAANAVFEIQVPQHEASGADFGGFLLRVAKTSAAGASTYDYLLQQRFMLKAIKPILGQHVVHQELVMLHKSAIVRELNNHLRDINETRKPKFRGTYVGETDWGFLVEDMRPQDPEACVLVEFKPKWLSQSPSAPQDAVRCRQCAMELRNLVGHPSKSKAQPQRKPCPLALLQSNGPYVVRSPFRMAPQLMGIGDDAFYSEALDRIASHSALRNLKKQQDVHDNLGPLRASPADHSFVLAMTLRDCTCFAQIDKSSKSIRIRFGDFDWKDPGIKFERWRRVEEELVEGGFYTSEWLYCDKTFYRPPTLCLLEYVRIASSKCPAFIHVKDSVSESDQVLAARTDDVKIHHYTSDDTSTLKRLLDPYKVDAPEFVEFSSPR